jgi:hypothetical protein
MAKKKEEGPVTQDYICLVTISSLDGNERWTPGSKIALTDEAARIHLAAGNVAPLDNTNPPTSSVGPAVVIHTAESTAEVKAD